jgi:hypothetical protein
MPIEQIVYALLSSTLIFCGIKFAKHVWNVNTFYGKMQDLFNAYYTQYPTQSPEYFVGIVVRKIDAYKQFWVDDMNDFILEPSMLKELYEGASVYIKKCEAEERAKIELECAWCGNETTEKFLWFMMDEKDKTGTIQCQECFATCPRGTYEECVEQMKPYMEEEK